MGAAVSDETSVVLLFGSALGANHAGTLASERPDLATILGPTTSPAAVTVISYTASAAHVGVAQHIRLDPTQPPGADRWLARVGAFTIARRLAGSPGGRLLNSVGPVDPGRVFWRAVRHSADARKAIRHADVVIAGDVAAITAAWQALRRHWVPRALQDHRARSLLVPED
jgi:hypothetical protein